MKLSINRNILWCDVFTQRFSELGVKYACISPGSRSTPLTISLSSSKNIKVFPIVDERSSSFFALGLAKRSRTPVVVITTSGTAVAELYPAIIEAYYQRIPLIICTADRPPGLRDSGANQTINQKNIYKNHIRFFVDAGLPDIKKLKHIQSLAEKAINVSCYKNRGPVHINLPFEKPFEPKNYTDKINVSEIEKVFKKTSINLHLRNNSEARLSAILNKIAKTDKGLIITGFNNYRDDFGGLLSKFAKASGYPVYADGASHLRFGNYSKEYFIENMTALVRSGSFQKEYDPEIIIQFGGAPTSNVMLDFFRNSKAEKILINEFGDKNDPSHTSKTFFACDPSVFCEAAAAKLTKKIKRKSIWLNSIIKLNASLNSIKNKEIEKSKFPFEGRIITELFRTIPDKSNLMISNSLPVRDTDFFAPLLKKNIRIFTNRGASGIDGIVSTALGIAKSSKERTYLLIGDLAFYHDMNGLHNSLKYKIPLTVILVNNSGGGIFESLPISSYRNIMNNFLTPLQIEFKNFVEAYGGQFIRINSWNMFHQKLLYSTRSKKLTVLEIRTDAVESKQQRRRYWGLAKKAVEKLIDEIKSRSNRI